MVRISKIPLGVLGIIKLSTKPSPDLCSNSSRQNYPPQVRVRELQGAAAYRFELKFLLGHIVRLLLTVVFHFMAGTKVFSTI